MKLTRIEVPKRTIVCHIGIFGNSTKWMPKFQYKQWWFDERKNSYTFILDASSPIESKQMKGEK